MRIINMQCLTHTKKLII